MWGVFPDESGQFSGPSYLEGWVGNSNTPEARVAPNPGPWPFVYDNPLNLGYPVFDYRFLPTMGPVSLVEGDSLFVIGGWVVNAGLEGARQSADELLSAYYLGETGWDVPALPPHPSFSTRAATTLSSSNGAETPSPTLPSADTTSTGPPSPPATSSS